MAIEPPVMVIVPADGDRLPPLTLRAPLTEKLLEVVVVPEMVKPEKTNVAELVIEPPVMVIVPPDGEKLAVVPTVKAPATLKDDDVVTVAALAIVSAWNVSVPELAIEEPLLSVSVPEDGVKTPEAPTVKIPATVAVPTPVEIELAEILRLP